MNVIRVDRDNEYSPDVEINEYGQIVYTREIQPGALIAMPLHMYRSISDPRRLEGAELPDWLRSKEGKR